MANFITIVLDTTAPSNPTVSLNGGAIYSNSQTVVATIATGDATTTGYQMKVWGTVDKANDANIQDTEANSVWIAYSTSKQVKLSSGDGTKTVNVKIRDDVWNESIIATDTIELDTALPTANVGTPDVTTISKKAGKSIASFTISSPNPFSEYKVKVVSASGAIESSGTLIGTTNGSTNTSGTGSFSAPITVTVTGTDLELASSGDGAKLIKVFIKSVSGIWSV